MCSSLPPVQNPYLFALALASFLWTKLVFLGKSVTQTARMAGETFREMTEQAGAERGVRGDWWGKSLLRIVSNKSLSAPKRRARATAGSHFIVSEEKAAFAAFKTLQISSRVPASAQ